VMPDAVPAPEPPSRHASVLDLRILGRADPTGPSPGGPYRFWARSRAELPDDRQLHACVLTYLSDIGTGLARLPAEPAWSGPSLDHAMWFHHPARMDDWVLVDLVPVASAGARGFYTGTVHDRDGRLVATIAQEHVMRPNLTP